MCSRIWIILFIPNFNDVFLYLLKAGCYSRCAFREWRLVGDKLQLFCFKDYDALLATRPAVSQLLFSYYNFSRNIAMCYTFIQCIILHILQ
jgi:hypothetical protein